MGGWGVVGGTPCSVAPLGSVAPLVVFHVSVVSHSHGGSYSSSDVAPMGFSDPYGVCSSCGLTGPVGFVVPCTVDVQVLVSYPPCVLVLFLQELDELGEALPHRLHVVHCAAL